MNNKILLLIILILIGVISFLGFKNVNQISEDQGLPMSVFSISEQNQMFDITAEYPQFKSSDVSFNKKIENLVNERLVLFKEHSNDNWEAMKAVPGSNFGEYPQSPFYFEAKWRSVQLNKNYISFAIEIYTYEGGAHGDTQIYTFNYDIKNQKEISFNDFIGGAQENLNKLSEMAISNLENQILLTERDKGDQELRKMIKEGASPIFENYQNFTFDKNKFTIYFQKYQVAPGVFGIMKVDVYANQLYQIDIDYLK